MSRVTRSWSVPVVVAASLVMAAATQSGTAQAAQAAPSVSNGPTVYGSTVQLLPQEQWAAGIAREESTVGPLGVVRIFQNAPLPSILTPLADRSGIISFRLDPAQVLAGTYDAQFTAFFAAAPTDHPTYWSYYHEADVAYTHGLLTNLPQFRAAYTHIATLARAAHNPQLKTTVILVGYTANPASGLHVSDFMPASNLTDVIAWDNYNGWFTRQGVYGDPTNMIQLDQQAAAAVGKPWAVAEFGSLVIGHDTAGRAAYITAFAKTAAAYGATFVSYFDSDQYGQGADYLLTDPASQTAYRTVLTGTGVSVPDAPGNLVVTAGSGSAAVSWQAPDDHGTPVNSYQLTATDTTNTTTSAVLTQTVPAGTTSATLTGLTNGDTYTVTVTAVNALGSSAASAGQSVTPGGLVTVPDAPVLGAVAPSNTAATASWTAPANDGGSSVTSYTVTAINTTTHSTAGTATVTGSATSAAVTGLVNGQSYQLTVVATNGAGTGPASTSPPVTPYTAPGAPTGLKATGGNTSVTATWTAPTSNGAPITSYTVTAINPSTGTTVATTTVPGTATSGTVTGLTNGKSYTVTVTASNGLTGPTSAPSNTALSATVTTAPHTTAGGGVLTDTVTSATAFWNLPTANGGAAVTGYQVMTYQLINGTIVASTLSPIQPATARSLKVTGLIRKGTYKFSVIAINAAGPSPWAPLSNLVNAY